MRRVEWFDPILTISRMSLPWPIIVIALAAAVPGAAPGAATAQERAPTITLDTLKLRDQELEATRSAQKKAAETQKKLRDEIQEIGEDRRKLSKALIDAAARTREIEARLAAGETRLKALQGEEKDLQQSLEARRAVIAEVLAALQRMGRRPPPALLASADDALTALRSAMLLGAVLPDLRDRAQSVAHELADLAQLRAGIAAERTQLNADLSSLAEERQRMTLLTEQRQKRQAEAEQALEAERQKAATLARQVDNLKDLIARLEQGLDSATRAARAAARAEGQKGESRTQLSALRDPGRLAPAVSFASARGLLPLPVNGVKVRDFGASDAQGGTERGISIATRTGAQVTAPCDGWVVYAGPFRSYGQLLILNAGGGYHVLLAGMERISVELGQFVLTGEPVAVMGNGPQIAANVTINSAQPILYIEFRKDGVPVDPGPWWAISESEKVRG